MKRTVFLIIYLLAAVLTSHASHIVGGELEISQGRGCNYTITLKMYVDEIHQGMGVIAGETDADVGIYEKGTNRYMETVKLTRAVHSIINYGESCDPTADDIKTGMLIFTKSVCLKADIYNSPNGYYMSVEKCCRNQVIVNISDPAGTGMTFYTEFPAVVKNGLKFANSSPTFKQLAGDYPCKNRMFYFDMSGFDSNGDSLAYFVKTPLNAHVTQGSFGELYIYPGPAPYPPVTWSNPKYSETSQIPGNPSLSVNPATGMVSFKASETGLYVFGITVIEYRDGVQIGEVQRNFQIPVIECESNAPPSIGLTPKGAKPTYNPLTDTLDIRVEQDTCFTVIVADSSTIKYQSTETLKVSVLSNNVPPSIFQIAPTAVVSPKKDTVTTNFCLSACNKLDIKKDTTFTISLVVTDAPKCPANLAYYDTLNVVIKYKPQINARPKIGIVEGNGPFNLLVGQQLLLDVYGTDKDKLDMLLLRGEGIGFDLGQAGMNFPQVSGHDSITSQFRWTPFCTSLEPGTYKVRFIVDDNSCVMDNMDTTEVTINVADKTSSIKFNEMKTNLFTPNNDNINDYFDIPFADDGNCEYYFKKITIYNRWGARVFESTDPGFKWDGGTHPSGIYYVHVDMNKRLYKGWLEMVR